MNLGKKRNHPNYMPHKIFPAAIAKNPYNC